MNDQEISDRTDRGCGLLLLIVLAVVLAGGILGYLAYRRMSG